MSRQRRKPKAENAVTESNKTSDAVQGSGSLDPMLATLMSPVGFTKAMQPYALTDPYQTPPVVLRLCEPWAALSGGFRLESEDSTNDTFFTIMTGSGWDPAGINGTDHFDHNSATLKADNEAKTFEPATPVAARFVTNVWPKYDRLFRSGVKQAGTEVSFNSFLTITVLTNRLVSYILDLISFMQLREGIGNPEWDEIRGLFASANNLYAKALERRLQAVIEIAAPLPGIKGMIQETRRIKSPFLPIGADGTLLVPVSSYPLGAGVVTSPSSTFSNILLECEKILEKLRGSYADEVAAMKRHMPYTLADCDFTTMLPVTVDPFKTDGVINANFTLLNISGNEGTETESKYILVKEPASAAGFLSAINTQDVETVDKTNMFHTTMPGGVPGLSFLSSSLWLADDDLVDKEFALFTPHAWGPASIIYQAAYGISSIWSPSEDLGSYTYLKNSLSMQLAYSGATEFYMPFANKANVDLDAAVKVLQILVDNAFDFGTISKIDGLATTAMAPVTHPAVASVR